MNRVPFVFCRWRPRGKSLLILQDGIKCVLDRHNEIQIREGLVLFEYATNRIIGDSSYASYLVWDIFEYKTIEELMAVHWEEML